jgi:hypothetical protein
MPHKTRLHHSGKSIFRVCVVAVFRLGHGLSNEEAERIIYGGDIFFRAIYIYMYIKQ